jgi:hypothetical protein
MVVVNPSSSTLHRSAFSWLHAKRAASSGNADNTATGQTSPNIGLLRCMPRRPAGDTTTRNLAERTTQPSVKLNGIARGPAHGHRASVTSIAGNCTMVQPRAHANCAHRRRPQPNGIRRIFLPAVRCDPTHCHCGVALRLPVLHTRTTNRPSGWTESRPSETEPVRHPKHRPAGRWPRSMLAQSRGHDEAATGAVTSRAWLAPPFYGFTVIR